MKYPIGIQSFEKLRTEGYCYVDKTELIYQLVQNGSVYFLSRPRRFGKSLLVDTIDCYFSGKKELFKGLAIDRLESAWDIYPVFHIDFNGVDYTIPGMLETVLEDNVSSWETIYGKGENETSLSYRFMGVLKRASEQTGHNAVVLIDEYDKPLLDVFDSGLMNNEQSKLLEEEHRNILKAFYSTLKSADKYLRFVLLTGVTKFSQVNVFSGLNNLEDITLSDDNAAICGITQVELESIFHEDILALAKKYKVSENGMAEMLKEQFDGYHFGPSLLDIYNPFSILNTFKSKIIDNYWYSTGTPTYLVRLMNKCDFQIDSLQNKTFFRSDFMDMIGDSEHPLPMLFQSGYLTIKDFNLYRNTYILDFPNNEVRSGFLPLLTNKYLHIKDEYNTSSWAMDLSIMLEKGDLKNFINGLISFLASIPYDSHESLKDQKLSEKHFQYTFYLILRLIGSYRIKTTVEQCQAEGRVDCIAETNDFIYIFEFKHNGSAEAALKQIADRHYALPYKSDKRKVFCIGVNFSDETHNIDGWDFK